MTGNEQYIREIIDKLKLIDYIKPEDIPNIDLYMDQVTTFMDEHLKSLKRYEDDKMLTKTMINNYTKNDLLPSPEKKKYSKDHMLMLIFIYYFKNVLSISDIQSILNPLKDKYFKGSEPSLSDIYDTIFRLEEEQVNSTAKDILKKFNKSREVFEGQQMDEEFLNDFAFVCMLSFDVYIKKTIIEKMIDSNLFGDKQKIKANKDEGKSKEKVKDKDNE